MTETDTDRGHAREIIAQADAPSAAFRKAAADVDLAANAFRRGDDSKAVEHLSRAFSRADTLSKAERLEAWSDAESVALKMQAAGVYA